MKTTNYSTYTILIAIAISPLILTPELFEAKQVFGAAISKQPTYTKEELHQRSEEYFDRGVKLMKQGDYKKASEAFFWAVQNNKSWAAANSNLGYTYRKQNLYGKAIKYYKRAIKLDPELSQAHEYLGEAYAEMGEFEKAEEQLSILRELGSDEATKLEKFIADTKAGKKTGSKW